jgi:CubicO group peptidase (beta-lactamase class C family)
VPASVRAWGDLGRLDEYVREQAAQGRFSGAVLAVHRGRTVLERAYGMAELVRSVPNRPDTLFDLASVTKTFTAVAIAQLAYRKKVEFQETIGTYLDGFPSDIARNVTVHQLLTHTSGIGRPPTGSEPPPGSKDWDTVDEVWNGNAAYIRGLPRRFTSGTKYEYSNDGYFVLGEVVAAVSGKSYYDYVREHICTPAGMRRSGFYTRPEVRSRRDIARPYVTTQSGERVDATTLEYYPYVGIPSRGAYSSVRELHLYLGALRSGRLLDPSYVDLITSGKMVVPPTEFPALSRQSLFYGYGFRDFIVNDTRVVGHSGSGLGAANNVDTLPSSDHFVAILGNNDSPIHSIVELARQLITRRIS